jgi:hypothetical protein
MRKASRALGMRQLWKRIPSCDPPQFEKSSVISGLRIGNVRLVRI